MIRQLRPAVMCLLVLTLLTGVAYPLLVTGVAQTLFPRQARGSLIVEDSQIVGSELIGQSFDEPGYFWGRLSATSPVPYTAFDAEKLTGSSGSNFGPLNPALIAAAKRDRRAAPGRSRQRRADSRRLDHRLRQRLGPARQPRGRLLPGAPRSRGEKIR